MSCIHFPTTILHGTDALKTFATTLTEKKHKRTLLVTDKTLVQLGLVRTLLAALKETQIEFIVFDETHPNPIEADVLTGSQVFKENNCDSILALGGGSPMDVGKIIKIAATHSLPLSQYDDAIGGSEKITQPMPPLYAIPTTAGTGSEVGRSGVIILESTKKKHVIFAPALIPDIAVLAPELTVGLPPAITAATGLDALTHCLEAYFAPGIHPLADGIALEGIRIILKYLPVAYKTGDSLEARHQMLLAASMGAIAFQKGLGMIHSLSHPLSACYDTHHGLANALLAPASIAYLESAELSTEQQERIQTIHSLFQDAGWKAIDLSHSVKMFSESMGVELGLNRQGIDIKDISSLAQQAFADPCHQTNMLPVSEKILESVYRDAW